MTPTSSLLAARNCLQLQADRSMSSAIAGTHDNSPPATLKTARNLMAVPFGRRGCAAAAHHFKQNSDRKRPRRLFLELQIRGFDHIAVFDDVAVDDLDELLRRGAAGIDRHGLELG